MRLLVSTRDIDISQNAFWNLERYSESTLQLDNLLSIRWYRTIVLLNKNVSAERSIRVDRRTAGDLRYRLGLDHLGLCKPAMRSWNQSCVWQGVSVVWPVLVWYCWIYAAWGPPEQHSSESAEYDSKIYLECCTTGCCNNRFWISRRLG